MYLAPSDIHFLSEYTCDCLTPDETLLSVLSDRLLKMNELPKMQVVERNGAWFALNNSHLNVFRQLERQSNSPCRVRVDVVPLSKIPKSVQETMVVKIETSSRSVFSNNANEDGSMDCCQLEEGFGRGLLVQDQFKERNNGSLIRCIDTLVSNQGCGRNTKRGYQKLSAGNDDDDVLPVLNQLQPDSSEAENTMSSFSGTEYSDYDRDGDLEADSDSDYDESLTCNVCDRSFLSLRKLTSHQQRKRHYGCSVCDSIFPNLMTLELHKESLEHWSDDDDVDDDDDENDDNFDDGDDRNRVQNRSGGAMSDDDDSDADVHSPTEELERLL